MLSLATQNLNNLGSEIKWLGDLAQSQSSSKDTVSVPPTADPLDHNSVPSWTREGEEEQEAPPSGNIDQSEAETYSPTDDEQDEWYNTVSEGDQPNGTKDLH